MDAEDWVAIDDLLAELRRQRDEIDRAMAAIALCSSHNHGLPRRAAGRKTGRRANTFRRTSPESGWRANQTHL
jgi:hypothetical protein